MAKGLASVFAASTPTLAEEKAGWTQEQRDREDAYWEAWRARVAARAAEKSHGK